MNCISQYDGGHNTRKEYPEYKYSGDISTFHEWLCFHPKVSGISDEVMSILFQVSRKSESWHSKDRRNDKSLYIVHPIRTILSMVEKYASVFPADIITLLLHDVIEDHPELWYDVLSLFGLQVFRDVLILTKLPIATRKEILDWLLQIPAGQFDDPLVGNILQILSPQDPIKKLEYFSSYSVNIFGEVSRRMKGALILYRDRIIIPKGGNYETDDEYISLGNYLYFEKKDARRKLQDMLENMSDMHKMEKIKPGYIEKRRIKAYILGVKLRNFDMGNEYIELESKFQESGFSMIQDSEILPLIQNHEKSAALLHGLS